MKIHLQLTTWTRPFLIIEQNKHTNTHTHTHTAIDMLGVGWRLYNLNTDTNCY
jgi:hypothetical protein